jgi:hypothetical protein
MTLSCQTLFKKTQRKGLPLKLESLERVERLGYILGDADAAAKIEAFVSRHPDVLDMEPEQVAQVLATVGNVGPGTAVRYVLLHMWSPQMVEAS